MKDINLYLIRHGQTEWNIKDQMQGSKNSPLTDKGILGAKVTGKFLKDIPFIEAYSSDQSRAIQTRDYIINENNLAVPTNELAELREMDFGNWEGQYVPTLKKEVPEYMTFLNDPANYQAISSQGETFMQVLERMKKALAIIVKNAKQDKGNILIVSHGTVLRLLLCVLNGGDFRLHRDENYFGRILNTSISLVNYQQVDDKDSGKFTVKYFNHIDHLDN